MNTSPLLSIRNLSVEFSTNEGIVKALKNINISVSRGEILAIVGESGSGKSVTSLSILQLLPSPPTKYSSGEILLTLDNQTIDLLHLPEKQLCSIRGNQVAMIFQEPMTSLNPVLTCGYQVTEAIKQHLQKDENSANEMAISLFQKVRLPDLAGMMHRYPHQLSGGQKQRVMIAMAMSCNPALLICDEPTTALDVSVQKNILQLIKELQVQNNMGVIFITHDLSVVAEIADRVAVMYKGEIVEMATTRKLFTEPTHPYTKALLACRPLLHAKGERLPVVSDFMEIDSQGNIVEKNLPASTINDQMPSIVDEQLPTNNLVANSIIPLFSIDQLKVWYPATKSFLGKPLSYIKAVNDVSFEIYEGETLGLVGESGCGKSTLGRALIRLIPATAGHIYYKGFDMREAGAGSLQSLRKELQIIFQDPYSSLNPRMTIGEAIEEPLYVHQIEPYKAKRKEKVIELLEKVNLKPDHYTRYPHEFSGGQRQRIVIARALALRPRFLICDESVSALDVSVQAQVLNLLNEIKREFGFTAVFISHDLSVVRYISDRIIVMQKGKIAETGLAESLYQQPQSAYTRELVAAIPKGIF